MAVTMKTKIEGTQKDMSRLIFGTGITVLTDKGGAEPIEALDASYEAGFRTYNTARIYGDAELNVGRWISMRGNREDIVIIDKGCNPGHIGSEDEMTPELIERQLSESLERLQCEYVDFYMLHRDQDTKEVGPIMEVLNKLKEEGKIRRFGGSNWRWQRFKEANDYAASHGLEGFTAHEPAFSIMEMVGDPYGCSISISGEKNKDARAYYLENNIPIFAYSPLARSFLSGKYVTDGNKPIEECIWKAGIEEYYYPQNVERLKRVEQVARAKGCTVPQVALAWLVAQELNVFPIVGASTNHLQDNIQALSVELTAEEMAFLSK